MVFKFHNVIRLILLYHKYFKSLVIMASGKFCPFIGKKCVEHKCALYTSIQGYNHNTGQDVNQWGCSLTFLPMLSIEIAAKENQTGAAIESLRNEFQSSNRTNQKMYMNALKTRVVPVNVKLEGGDTTYLPSPNQL